MKLINKDSLLQKVYGGKYEKYNYTKLNSAAYANELADEAIKTLTDIYESIIFSSDFHVKLYNGIDITVKTPRRYGKNQIRFDIEAQGGVPTSAQETMLLLADLKAITSTLLDRGVSDRYKGTERISEANHRKIKSAIRDLKKKLVPILKKI